MTESLWQDLRVGLRVLIREKSFCTLAVIVLALGICGVTTMFSVVNGVMLRGFSFPTADRLVSVTFIDPTSQTFNGVNQQMSDLDYQELLPAQQSFDLLAAYLNGSTVNMTVDGHPRRYTGAYTTENFLRILGTAPMMGRDFTAADNKPGAEKVALIGYGVWQRDFGAASDIVGREVRLNGKSATIIGVMPQGFAFPTNEEIWIPLFSEYPPRPRNDPAAVNPAVLGLLKPGVSLDRANAEVTGIARRFAAAYPASNKLYNTGQVQPLIQTFTNPGLRGTLWVMLGFCLGVLLIACVNVMNMQFARATLRAKELAIRSSLGATRVRLLRQMLTESFLVATIGTAVGIALAYFSTDWLSATVHNFDSPPPNWMVFDVNGTVLAVTVGATVLAAVASGLLPAWMSSRANAVGALREGGRGNTSRSTNLISRGLVVFQIVVTCVLLVGALLQVRSIVKQQNLDFGYDTTGLMSARMGLMDGDYPTQDARKLFFDHLLTALRNDPEFESAALTTRFRMAFAGNGPIEIEGKTYATNRDRPNVNFEPVSSDFFRVTGQKVLQGRGLTDEDLDTRQPIAVVNEAFASKYFGSASAALGHRLRTVNADGTNPSPWRTIVGVTSTVRMLGPFNTPNVDDTGFYVPFYASPTGPALLVSQFATILVKPRSGEQVDALAGALRREVAKVDPNLPLYFIGTPKSQIATFLAGNRVLATMFSIFGLVAVVLASVGIYGVMSFAVNQRTQEFGVRMALGANGGRILGMVLSQGVLQIAIGLTLGLGLALTLGTLMGDGIQNTLFGVTARDPLTYGAVTALVMVVSLFAAFMPARRATRVDPMVALRAE